MITLLTDFGLEDVYVGVMKGVICGIAPNTQIIDLNHNISAQDVREASFQLSCVHSYFPNGTIHMAVVDPGVGSAREAITIQTEKSFLVGPNNGIFSHTLDKTPPKKIVELNNPEFWLSQHPSHTFHGRDIFAPVAAHLAKGVPIEDLGTSLHSEHLVLFELSQSYSEITHTGQIQAIDHFGNLITTIPAHALQKAKPLSWSLKFQDHTIPGQNNYSDVSIGEAIALIGSHGYLEIAVNQGNAQQFFTAHRHDSVKLIMKDKESL